MQRSPTVVLGESSVPTAGSLSHSGSSSGDSNPENSLNGSRKRKRSFTISYVIVIYCGFERRRSVECSEADFIVLIVASCAKRGRSNVVRTYSIFSPILLTL
jgi:hypothetical protein